MSTSDPRSPSSAPPRAAPAAETRGWAVAWAGLILIGALTAGTLALMGQPWWCACGQIRPWVHDIWSSHCSQHLLDAYSLTHVSHGLILAPVLWLVARRWRTEWRLVAVMLIEAGWEVLENSPPVIERYRTATASLNYAGDSVVNSMGDLLSCAIGFLIVHRLGWKVAMAIFVVTEVALLVLIRDNLTLNVLMLLWPVQAVRDWQVAGQAG